MAKGKDIEDEYEVISEAQGEECLHTILEDLEQFAKTAEPHLETAKEKIQEARTWIKKNPEKAVAAAAVIGALSAALLGRRRK